MPHSRERPSTVFQPQSYRIDSTEYTFHARHDNYYTCCPPSPGNRCTEIASCPLLQNLPPVVADKVSSVVGSLYPIIFFDISDPRSDWCLKVEPWEAVRHQRRSSWWQTDEALGARQVPSARPPPYPPSRRGRLHSSPACSHEWS